MQKHGEHRRRTPAPTTTSRWSRSTPPTSARSTRRSRSGAARPASTPTAPPPATGSTPTATPACAPASSRSRRTPAPASATTPADGGWSHPRLHRHARASPATPAAGFMSADGKALGVLSTRRPRPAAGSNGVGDLAKELAFAQAHSGIAGLQPGQRHRAVLAGPLTGGLAASRPGPVSVVETGPGAVRTPAASRLASVPRVTALRLVGVGAAVARALARRTGRGATPRVRSSAALGAACGRAAGRRGWAARRPGCRPRCVGGHRRPSGPSATGRRRPSRRRRPHRQCGRRLPAPARDHQGRPADRGPRPGSATSSRPALLLLVCSRCSLAAPLAVAAPLAPRPSSPTRSPFEVLAARRSAAAIEPRRGRAARRRRRTAAPATGSSPAGSGSRSSVAEAGVAAAALGDVRRSSCCGCCDRSTSTRGRSRRWPRSTARPGSPSTRRRGRTAPRPAPRSSACTTTCAAGTPWRGAPDDRAVAAAASPVARVAPRSRCWAVVVGTAVGGHHPDALLLGLRRRGRGGAVALPGRGVAPAPSHAVGPRRRRAGPAAGRGRPARAADPGGRAHLDGRQVGDAPAAPSPASSPTSGCWPRHGVSWRADPDRAGAAARPRAGGPGPAAAALPPHEPAADRRLLTRIEEL